MTNDMAVTICFRPRTLDRGPPLQRLPLALAPLEPKMLVPVLVVKLREIDPQVHAAGFFTK